MKIEVNPKELLTELDAILTLASGDEGLNFDEFPQLDALLTSLNQSSQNVKMTEAGAKPVEVYSEVKT